MLNHIRPALAMILAMTALTGLAYPLAMTGIARVIAPAAAGGSLVFRDAQPVGSTLVGQGFSAPGYLQPRPSAVDYATLPSGASNLGPGSEELAGQVAARRAAFAAAYGTEAPIDAVTASASGLDPHVSPETALAQADRIARARQVDPAMVRAVIAARIEPRWLGLFGEPRVNVLLTNVALDEAAPAALAGGS